MTHGRGLAGGFGVLVALMVAQGTAHAAELVVEDRGGVPGQVTVPQGKSAEFTLDLAAVGHVSCIALRNSGVGARVHTRYRVGYSGVSSSVLSRFLAFYSNGRPDLTAGGTCGVSWDGAGTPYKVRARVDVATDARPGVHMVPLLTAVSNPAATVQGLTDDRLGVVRIRVTARYSRPGRILLVNANLKAANLTDSRSLRRGTGRMRLFVDRMLRDLRRARQPLPDVLTLQEVVNRRGRSAAYVARYLSRKTGDPYRIVVSPARYASLHRPRNSRTAIIANLDTMRKPTVKGFVRSPCRAWSSACRRSACTCRQAYALLREAIRGGRTFPIASVHVIPRINRLFSCRGMPCARRVAQLRRSWVDAVVRRLRRVSGRSWTRAVIAGDFNATRGQPFYRAIRGAGFANAHPWLDAATDALRHIDFIFTRGRVVAADYDRRRRRGPRSRKFDYGYSDHRFLWVSVGG
jgi:hypothetical protein